MGYAQFICILHNNTIHFLKGTHHLYFHFGLNVNVNVKGNVMMKLRVVIDLMNHQNHHLSLLMLVYIILKLLRQEWTCVNKEGMGVTIKKRHTLSPSVLSTITIFIILT